MSYISTALSLDTISFHALLWETSAQKYQDCKKEACNFPYFPYGSCIVLSVLKFLSKIRGSKFDFCISCCKYYSLSLQLVEINILHQEDTGAVLHIYRLTNLYPLHVWIYSRAISKDCHKMKFQNSLTEMNYGSFYNLARADVLQNNSCECLHCVNAVCN